MSETMNFVIDSTHSDVNFVDFEILVFPVRFGVFPLVVVQIDINTVKGVIDVLSGKIDPGWDPVNNVSILEFDLALDFRKLGNIFLNGTTPLSVFVLN